MTRPLMPESWRSHVHGRVRPSDEPRTAWFEIILSVYMAALFLACSAIALGLWNPVSPAASERPATPASADAAGGRGDGE